MAPSQERTRSSSTDAHIPADIIPIMYVYMIWGGDKTATSEICYDFSCSEVTVAVFQLFSWQIDKMLIVLDAWV